MILDLLHQGLRAVQRRYGRAEFRNYEQACIDAWLEALPRAESELARRLVDSLRLVQRSPGDRLVCCYGLDGDDTSPVSLCAEVSLRIGRRRLNALLERRASGRLFSLSFDRSPKALGWTANDGVEVKVEVMKLFGPSSGEGPVVQGRLPAWVRKLATAGVEVRPLAAPLPTPPRQKILRSVGYAVPKDYAALLRVANGIAIGVCQVNGLSSPDLIPLPKGEMFVLVEGAQGRRYGLTRRTGATLACIEPDLHDTPTGRFKSVEEIVKRELARG